MGDNDQAAAAPAPDAEGATAPDAQPAVGGTPSDDANPADTTVKGGLSLKFACSAYTAVDATLREAITARLKDQLAKLTFGGQAVTWNVGWDFKEGEIKPTDVVIYFVSQAGASLIDQTMGAKGGLTNPNEPMICEVYTTLNKQTLPALLIANCALHEMMHAKLKKGPEMHTETGLRHAITDESHSFDKADISVLNAKAAAGGGLDRACQFNTFKMDK